MTVGGPESMAEEHELSCVQFSANVVHFCAYGRLLMLCFNVIF